MLKDMKVYAHLKPGRKGHYGCKIGMGMRCFAYGIGMTRSAV